MYSVGSARTPSGRYRRDRIDTCIPNSSDEGFRHSLPHPHHLHPYLLHPHVLYTHPLHPCLFIVVSFQTLIIYSHSSLRAAHVVEELHEWSHWLRTPCYRIWVAEQENVLDDLGSNVVHVRDDFSDKRLRSTDECFYHHGCGGNRLCFGHGSAFLW